MFAENCNCFSHVFLDNFFNSHNYLCSSLSLFYYNLVHGKIPRVRIIFQRQFYVLINPKIEAKFNKATATNWKYLQIGKFFDASSRKKEIHISPILSVVPLRWTLRQRHAGESVGGAGVLVLYTRNLMNVNVNTKANVVQRFAWKIVCERGKGRGKRRRIIQWKCGSVRHYLH